jgi:hypothetical protein
VVPSPKSQAWLAIVPSVSVEPAPSKAAVRSVAVAVKDAVGATFGALPVVPVRVWSATRAAGSAVG